MGDLVDFKDVFADVTRKAVKIPAKAYEPEGIYPIIDQGQNTIAGYSDSENGIYDDVPAIVFGDHTCAVKYVEEPFFIGADGTKVLKPLRSDDLRFLFHALRYYASRLPGEGEYTRHFKWLKECVFVIPDIDEQHRIANILDGIESQIVVAKQMLAKADELIQSRFVEMFDDPTVSSDKILGDVADIQTGATPLRSNAEYYDGRIPWVKTGEIDYSVIKDASEHISDKAVQETNCKLFPIGTILIAMYGQGNTRGKAGILGVEAATNQACAAVLLDAGICNPMFMLWQLKLKYEELRSMSLGGNQKNLSLGIVKSLSVSVPPLALQNEFAEFVTSVESLKSTTRQQLDRLTTLYASLTQRYFAQ
ncbi:restriction endonuclease subunit S [Bifidobacterium ramosum]|uniref:Restriction endonuclease subunit S n=1 Tax=Bifidobacterium ramosum TaxID=1798158 RepID=A0A6L4X289_9BIFI|nr:restriction endonuclease subunit S [Bifidobacterium ramosum]KAB8289239.1 restriction endonuclease subunit S [Bifidobacterium ramosum]NEG70945.1 hypothetical protein [Bifidobacterium ramosum]